MLNEVSFREKAKAEACVWNLLSLENCVLNFLLSISHFDN